MSLNTLKVGIQDSMTTKRRWKSKQDNDGEDIWHLLFKLLFVTINYLILTTSLVEHISIFIPCCRGKTWNTVRLRGFSKNWKLRKGIVRIRTESLLGNCIRSPPGQNLCSVANIPLFDYRRAPWGMGKSDEKRSA